MSENLRDEIAEAILANFNPPDDKHASWWINPHLSADAVLAVVGPELDRLRAEVERHLRNEQVYIRHLDQARAERDDLRARLAKVEALVSDTTSPDVSCGGMGVLAEGCYVSDLALKVRAALASVPEPSDSEPAPDADRADGAS